MQFKKIIYANEEFLYLWSEGWVDLTDDFPEHVSGDVTVPLLVVYPAQCTITHIF
jgi:hypothetical protein